MISRILGTICGMGDSYLLVKTGGISYEILIPRAIMKNIEKDYGQDKEIELVIYHYYQMEQSRAIPILIGFVNEVEKEFFEKFISVSGVGPKAACKALAEPFSLTAGAIDRADSVFLKGLPGIGERKAREIIAKLQGKVGKYGLIKDEDIVIEKEKEDIAGDALEVLLQLQYKKIEAEAMIKKALLRNPDVKTSEDLLNEVYRDRVKQ